MRNLTTDPLWREEDLGKAIPDSRHAVSVALPLWKHVVGYEEKDPEVVERMLCGYPRFFNHPIVQELFDEAAGRLGAKGEKAMVLPSRGAAERCLAYIESKGAVTGRVAGFGEGGLWAALFPAAGMEAALKFWQHAGEIVSSRLAESVLGDGVARGKAEGGKARGILKDRLAGHSGQAAEDVFLFSSGMAAVFAVHRALNGMFPGRKCVQLEFPYIDVLKVQEQFGPGVHFLPLDGSGDLRPLEKLLEKEEIAGAYCELASNPLLRTVDILRLGEILKKYEVPLIADDTIGTVVNIDAYRAADVVTTSLTKYFSGVGDVLAGCVTLRSGSPFHAAFGKGLAEAEDDALWDGDAVVLEKNSRDFEDRVRTMNRNGEALFDYLEGHPKVERVWYPKNETRENYDRIRRPGGGYAALMSILLRDAAETSPKFYDALRVSKGPSLGTNYSLVCPYTLLAHYGELDWAESCGVSRHLIRISVGMEDAEEMTGRFEEALRAVNR